MLRTLLVACIAFAAAAADRTEVFTLADGRSFTGTYDEDAGVLHTATPAGKAFDLKLAAGQIADRAPAKKATAASVAEPTKRSEPAPMSSEDKASANRDFAYQQKLREADALDADGAKLKRDAAEARKLAQKQMEHARNDWRAFCERAGIEGIGLDPEGPISETLIVLPRTKGNNRGSMDGVVLSKQTSAKAPELEQLAAEKAQAATAARATAAAMPHGSGADPQPIVATSATPAPKRAAIASAPAASDLLATVLALEKADNEEDARHAAARADLVTKRAAALTAWLKSADLHDAPLPTLGANPPASEARDYQNRRDMNETLARLRSAQSGNAVAETDLVLLAKNHWPLFVSTR